MYRTRSVWVMDVMILCFGNFFSYPFYFSFVFALVVCIARKNQRKRHRSFKTFIGLRPHYNTYVVFNTHIFDKIVSHSIPKYTINLQLFAARPISPFRWISSAYFTSSIRFVSIVFFLFFLGELCVSAFLLLSLLCWCILLKCAFIVLFEAHVSI